MCLNKPARVIGTLCSFSPLIIFEKAAEALSFSKKEEDVLMLHRLNQTRPAPKAKEDKRGANNESSPKKGSANQDESTRA
jgi:hypothetical protein